MNRQYIGARYVPIIDGAWNSTKVYEPLTIVTYNNGSYTSKKNVPAGIAPTNTEYWVLTGNYNAQVEEYRQEVVELNEKVDNLGNRKIVFIADSYATFHNITEEINFIELACSYVGLVKDTDYFEFYISGAGFCREGNQNFLAVLQNGESVITDKSEITDIIVCGSANDQTGTYNTIRSGINSFMNYVHSHYENAKVHIGCFSKSLESATLINMLPDVYRAYKDGATFNGEDFINNSEFVMTWLSRFKTDLLHPNADGIYELGKWLGMYLIGGSINVIRHLTMGNNVQYPNDSWFTQRSGVNNTSYISQDNGVIGLAGDGGNILSQATTTRAIEIAPGTFQKTGLMILNDTLFYPKARSVSCNAELWYGNTKMSVLLIFEVNNMTNNGIPITVVFENPTESNVTIPNATNVSFILKTPFIVVE